MITYLLLAVGFAALARFLDERGEVHEPRALKLLPPPKDVPLTPADIGGYRDARLLRRKRARCTQGFRCYLVNCKQCRVA